ncbi:MAG: hypothetical protein ABI303_03235 [Candidatus Saccharimonas sp.]
MPDLKVDKSPETESDRLNELRHRESVANGEYGQEAIDAGTDQLEAHANDPANASAKVRESESGEAGSDAKWNVNRDKSSKKAKTGRLKAALKNKGAITVLIALIGGGATLPFIGAAALPAAILGNMNDKSMLHGLQQYMEDYTEFAIFGGKTGAVQTKTDSLKGLSQKDIKVLEANGVKLEGPEKTLTGKTTFTSVSVNGGESVKAGAEFKNAMRTNPAFRSAMIFNKGSYWKSAKSGFAAKVKSIFKFNADPDLSGNDDKARTKKLVTASVEPDNSISPKPMDSSVPEDPSTVDNLAKNKSDAEGILGELSSEVDAQKALVADGTVPDGAAARSSSADIAEKLNQNGFDVTGDATKGIGGKIWSFANTLDIADMVCTIYQTASIANNISRTVALTNIVRFAMTVRASLEKMEAGDDNDGSTNYLMSILHNKDPTTGQSFDQSSYASVLFTGQLSSQPSAVSAFGGQAMIMLYMAMHSINQHAGEILGGDATTGRTVLKTFCNFATNLGVQVLATAGSLVLGFLSGGASLAVSKGAEEAGKVAIKKGAEEVVEKASKEIIEKTTKEISEKTAEGATRNMASKSWSAFKGIYANMSIWNKIGILVAGVGTFGMSSIIDSLSGSDIAGFTGNGVSAMDALGTGQDVYDSRVALADGGNIATYNQVADYQQTKLAYENSYTQDMSYQAKDTPFDLSNPNSQLGTMVFGMQKMIGLSAISNFPSFIKSLAYLPMKLPNLLVAHAADNQPTPENIANIVGNPYYQENKIATTITGSPQIIFQKHYSFEDVMNQLLGTDITYDGDNSTSGEPILTIAPGSDLSEYADKCHNPAKTELDPEFIDGDGALLNPFEASTNGYDISTCVPGGDHYEPIYTLYDDAIRYIGQVSPDTSTSTSDQPSPSDGTITPDSPNNNTLSPNKVSIVVPSIYSSTINTIVEQDKTTQLASILNNSTMQRQYKTLNNKLPYSMAI